MAKKKRRRRGRKGKYSLKRIGIHPLDQEIDWSVCYTRDVKPGDPLSPSGLVRLSKDGRNGKIAMQVKGTCTWCGEKVPPRRSTWCSNVCVRAYSLTQASTLRAAVYTRDRGHCSGCGLDTDAFKKQLKLWNEELDGCELSIAQALTDAGKDTEEDVVQHLVSRRTLWDMDHIEPVSKGGDLFSLENLRTLCYWCHKAKTREDVRKK